MIETTFPSCPRYAERPPALVAPLAELELRVSRVDEARLHRLYRRGMARVLALDVGTSSIRALVHNEDGEPGGEMATRKYDTTDADEIVDCVRSAIDEALRGEEVDAVGASTFGHSLLVLDERGRPAAPVLTWRDTRSEDAADWLKRRLDPQAVHARTGAYLHSSYWPAKLAWLAEEEPELFRSAARFVSFADYLYERLTGERPQSSVSLASGTGLVDLASGDWDQELLETLGVDPERLPPLGDEPAGGWYPALFDGVCSNLGAGCVTRERAALMVGTSGAYRVLYETERPQPRRGLFLYRVDERRVRPRARPPALRRGYLSSDEPSRRCRDRVGVDLGRMQELRGLARARHLAHGELDDGRPLVGLGERREHRLAEPALGEVVLDGHDRHRERAQRLLVERFDRVEVDHAGLDALLGERVGRLERLRDGHARRHDRDVVAVAKHAAAADLELLVRVVDHRRRRPQRAEI